jgi:hypothetical protein
MGRPVRKNRPFQFSKHVPTRHLESPVGLNRFCGQGQLDNRKGFVGAVTWVRPPAQEDEQGSKEKQPGEFPRWGRNHKNSASGC